MSPPDTSSGSGGIPLRETILREATRLFAEQGYKATSIRQVVEASQCTKPALYYYFANKDDLYIKVVEREVEVMMELGRRVIDDVGSVRDRLFRSLKSFVSHAHENPEAMTLLHRAEMERDQGQPDINVADSRKMHLQLIAQLIDQGIQRGEIRDGVDPRDCAVALAGTLTFQFQLWLLCGEPWPEGQLERTLNLLFDGIEKR